MSRAKPKAKDAKQSKPKTTARGSAEKLASARVVVSRGRVIKNNLGPISQPPIAAKKKALTPAAALRAAEKKHAAVVRDVARVSKLLDRAKATEAAALNRVKKLQEKLQKTAAK